MGSCGGLGFQDGKIRVVLLVLSFLRFIHDFHMLSETLIISVHDMQMAKVGRYIVYYSRSPSSIPHPSPQQNQTNTTTPPPLLAASSTLSTAHCTSGNRTAISPDWVMYLTHGREGYCNYTHTHTPHTPVSTKNRNPKRKKGPGQKNPIATGPNPESKKKKKSGKSQKYKKKTNASDTARMTEMRERLARYGTIRVEISCLREVWGVAQNVPDKPREVWEIKPWVTRVAGTTSFAWSSCVTCEVRETSAGFWCETSWLLFFFLHIHVDGER